MADTGDDPRPVGLAVRLQRRHLARADAHQCLAPGRGPRHDLAAGAVGGGVPVEHQDVLAVVLGADAVDVVEGHWRAGEHAAHHPVALVALLPRPG